MAPLTRPANARQNYDWLLGFARYMRDTHPGHAVRVVDQAPLGLGLQAARDIAQGEIVVWYGAPYVSTRTIVSEHATHSAQVIDPSETSEQIAERGARALDGKILSAAFQDPVVTEAERDELLLIAGPMVNSSRDEDNNDVVEQTVAWKPDFGLLRWMSPEGIEFAAKPFVAMRFIPEGTDLRWSYPYKGHVAEPMGFRDMRPRPPPPPPTKPKKRAVLMPNPGGCGCSKAARTGVGANGLVSLAGLRL